MGYGADNVERDQTAASYVEHPIGLAIAEWLLLCADELFE
jgi:hypothetical protein